jgi:hypothetical protein
LTLCRHSAPLNPRLCMNKQPNLPRQRYILGNRAIPLAYSHHKEFYLERNSSYIKIHPILRPFISLTESRTPPKALPSQRENGQLNRLHRHPECALPLLLCTRHQRPQHAPPSPNTGHRRPISIPRRRHARHRSRDLDHFETVSQL